MVALGWVVVSDYGDSHSSDWTIGVCRVLDSWIVELGDGTSLHAKVDSSIAAAKLHRELSAESKANAPPDLHGQHEVSN